MAVTQKAHVPGSCLLRVDVAHNKINVANSNQSTWVEVVVHCTIPATLLRVRMIS